ncbi:carbohydrate ABC transporter permease, partial [bacterium]|nr:carbohydrate ABC transporter permease [bacterium]
ELPGDVDVARFGAIEQEVRAALSAAVRQARLPVADHLRLEAEAEVTEGLWQRLFALTPIAAWTNEGLDAAQLVNRSISPEEIQGVANQCYRRFSIQVSRARDDAMSIHNLALDAPVTAQWHSLSPDASLEERVENGQRFADVIYGFSRTNVIVLEGVFDLPFPASNLFQYCLGYRADDTWHRLRVRVEGGGRRMESAEPVYLFDYLWATAAWQRPSEQDREIKIKRWVETRITGQGPQFDHGASRIKVFLRLERSSLPEAWVGKIERNYRATFKYIPFWRYVGTSVFLVVLSIAGTLFASTFVAYAFARLRWPGRDLCFMALLATLMVPGQVTMIPGFLIVKSLGWYNTLQPLWAFSFFGNAFFIFLLRQFMKGIPNDLEDAARIDGCGFLRIYWYVILPLIKPTMAAIAIFTFMGCWNDFMGPLIMLNDFRLYPLSLGLFSLNVQAGGNLGMMMASSFLMTLPVIVLFFFAQKYFIQGVTLTGMKG